MNICVIGAGYVGLVSGACLAEIGNHVTCVDSDARKIESLNRGILPIYEPGLEPLVARNRDEGRLVFTTSLAQGANGAEVCMIAVGTPSGENGSANLDHVLEVARELGRTLADHCIIATKSTVPVGTTRRVKQAIEKEIRRRGLKVRIDVASNPEFLKEGDAVNDFMRPDRIVIGAESERAARIMRELYAPFTRNHERTLMMGLEDAEMTKYAANAMLATKISFMNEIADLCERLGVDVENVRLGIGSDSRIGYAFIYPGCGYGGSCLPKDVRALIHAAGEAGVESAILEAVEKRNAAQKRRLYEKIIARFGPDLDGLTIAVWGLAFKPGTDDLREAPSLALIESVLGAGAQVKAYDPAAMDAARRSLPRAWFERGALALAEHQYDALEGADALVLVTEWKPFRNPDFHAMKRIMKQPIIFDGRNQYDPRHLREQGFEYYCIGRGNAGRAG
jgi:UDPglucose 6-dehydrogenase